METIKKILSWLIAITPTWLRAVVVFLLASLVFIYTLTACGTTRAVVHTKDSGTATITITTNNPIDVSTTPNINIELPTINN